jgi:5-methylcytosine-specific restriction enzyme A
MADRREFTTSVKRAVLQRSGGMCEIDLCSEDVKQAIGETCGKVGKDFDHALADCLGGEPTFENCVLLCTEHHKAKTKLIDQKARAKRNKHTVRKGRPKPGWFQSGQKLQSRGFDKTKTKGFDGVVRERKP